ncbi:unnamed protein product [Discula destructiva]
MIRKSCRKIKDCSTILAAGDVPELEDLNDSEAALKTVYEACTDTDPKQIVTEVEVILGSLLRFLGDLKGNLECAIDRTKGESATAHGSEEALQSLLSISAEWHQGIQQRMDETLQKRKAWENIHPIQAAQEHELSLYIESLLPIQEAPSARAISSAQWQRAETSLASLQVYLLENKISAQQVRSGGEQGIVKVLKDILGQLEEWDAKGLGFMKDERVDLQLVEKIWGRVDKIGSGLSYLLTLNERGDEVDGMKPTTRSVFLLKSAPPVAFSFSSNREVWLVKQLSASRERLVEIVLNPNEADIKRDDEQKWNAAYRELEALDRLVRREAKQASKKMINDSRIEEVMRLLCAKLESLHIPSRAGEDESAYALMYVSWELTMRIGAALGFQLSSTVP